MPLRGFHALRRAAFPLAWPRLHAARICTYMLVLTVGDMAALPFSPMRQCSEQRLDAGIMPSRHAHMHQAGCTCTGTKAVGAVTRGEGGITSRGLPTTNVPPMAFTSDGVHESAASEPDTAVALTSVSQSRRMWGSHGSRAHSLAWRLRVSNMGKDKVWLGSGQTTKGFGVAMRRVSACCMHGAACIHGLSAAACGWAPAMLCCEGVCRMMGLGGGGGTIRIQHTKHLPKSPYCAQCRRGSG